MFQLPVYVGQTVSLFPSFILEELDRRAHRVHPQLKHMVKIEVLSTVEVVPAQVPV
jgi:hypothetical protein